MIGYEVYSFVLLQVRHTYLLYLNFKTFPKGKGGNPCE